MKALKVNADYESVLFENKSQPKINSVIEFLAFFLVDVPVISDVSYSDDYLSYIESISGIRPVIKRNGTSDNWWGELRNPVLEKTLNSKITSSNLCISEGWGFNSYVLQSIEDVTLLPELKSAMMAKNPHEMSGRGFRLFPHGIGESEKAVISTEFKKAPVILEPLLERVFDFSHYVFPDGKQICYQNIVDHKFQYKGTIFSDWKNAVVENLSFYNKIRPDQWSLFTSRLETIKDFYRSLVSISELRFGFCVDSLVHVSKDQLLIHPLCEVNFRRTMGRVAYELSVRYAQELNWTAFILLPQIQGSMEICRNFSGDGKVIHLSPDGARFTMLFLAAENFHKGEKLKDDLERLLALGKLPVGV